MKKRFLWHGIAGASVLAALLAVYVLTSDFHGSLIENRRVTPSSVAKVQVTNRALEFRQSSATAQIDESTRRAREGRTASEAEFREIAARSVSFDYAPLLSRLMLKPEKLELVLQALTDQLDAATAEEKRQYDELLRQLLGDDAFAQLALYRDHLPTERQIAAGLAALKSASPSVDAAEEAAARNALELIPPVNSLAIEVVKQTKISDADIQRVVTSYEKLFDEAFAQSTVGVATRATLREWYLREHISVQMNVLKIQQTILKQKGG